MVFPDTVSLRFDTPVPAHVVRTLSNYKSTWDAEGAFVREAGYDGHLYVQRTETGGRLAGSLRN